MRALPRRGAGPAPGRDHDDELLILGCVVDDLSEQDDGEQRFELDGADLAAGWLSERGVAGDRVEVVWDAVALHLQFELAARKRPEIALVGRGRVRPRARRSGPPAGATPTASTRATAPARRGAIVGQALVEPQKAPPFSTPAELVRQVTGQCWPTWRELVEDAGWNDFAGYRSPLA